MISSIELARICGVSQGTVDRALHGRPGIAAATRERILAAAEQHGYLPHPAAREMIKGERSMVAAVVPDTRSMYFWDLALALKDALQTGSAPLRVAPVNDTEAFLAAVTEFASRRAAGLVLIPPAEKIRIPSPLLKGLRAAALFTPLLNPEAAFISPDEAEAGRLAVEHLFAAGHRRIVHLTVDRDFLSVRGRRKGYEEAMQAHGLEPAVVQAPAGEGLAKLLKKNQATALFAFNDWTALTAIRALNQSGIRVPEDAAVVGVDASPGFAELAPGITSVAYPFEAVARLTAAYILEGQEITPAGLKRAGVCYRLNAGTTG